MTDLRITQTRYRLIRHIAKEWVVRDPGPDEAYWDFNYGQVVTARVRELISAGLAVGTKREHAPVTLTDAGRKVLEGGDPAS